MLAFLINRCALSQAINHDLYLFLPPPSDLKEFVSVCLCNWKMLCTRAMIKTKLSNARDTDVDGGNCDSVDINTNKLGFLSDNCIFHKHSNVEG